MKKEKEREKGRRKEVGDDKERKDE